ncbi:MAG: Arm DNA-binding domain-containing protein [Desulfovibrio sp.]|jgi:hypothetical protein|nr:Arm DNA-binding domain-containing protein [Desulfovibrio sp.]
MPLTDISVRNTEIKNNPYRITDSDKLSLQIYPNGVKSWRVRYRRNDKETMLSLGNYPAVSLKEARAKRDEINVLLSKHIDPADTRRKTAALEKAKNMTLNMASEIWLAERKPPSMVGKPLRRNTNNPTTLCN